MLAATIPPKPPRSQTRSRAWTVAIFDLHKHIDASIDFSIDSRRCVDMSAQRPARFFSDDRQIVSKSLPEVDQKSQKSDQNRHRFTLYSKLHYVASINQSMHRYLENNGFEPWLFIKISCKQSFQHSLCDGLSWIKVAQQFSTLDIYRFWGS